MKCLVLKFVSLVYDYMKSIELRESFQCLLVYIHQLLDSMPKKTNKSYNLGENRVLSTRKEHGELVISIKDTKDVWKFADLPAQRWLSFVLYQTELISTKV